MLTKAKWITSPSIRDEGSAEFYRSIMISKEVAHASLCVSAIGLYVPYLDGERIGNELLTPGWTEYAARVQYQTYELVPLSRGEHELCLMCGEGWAVGNFGHHNNSHYASDHISVIYALDIEYADGTKERIVSDTATCVRDSQIVRSQIYDGEITDATRKKEEYGAAVIDDEKKPTLVPQQGEAVRTQERLRAVRAFTTPAGERVIDFGQNLAGYVEVRMSAPHGTRVTISHAEILDSDGNFYTENLRRAKQQCTYTFAGTGVETFFPHYSWQGFRYIRLDEYPFDTVDPGAFTAVVIHSDMKRTGRFECGNEKINQLYHNVIWGQKSNYIDVPTDCPQRDERLGWTGDTQVFARTAAINFDVERFLTKWLADLAFTQDDSGGVIGFVPRVALNDAMRISAGWGDAAVICPWQLYLAYGNKEIFEAQFESMRKWIEYMHNAGDEEYLWIGGTHYGDWLAMDAGDDMRGATPHDYIASCYYAYSTKLFIKAGEVIGRDMSEYRTLYQNIVKALHGRFFAEGVPTCRTQTAYALAIHFDLCIDFEKTAQGLAEFISENNGLLNTGFLGTPYLLHALTAAGRNDLAYNLLFEERFPSWLFSVNHGATTMWEHWDGVKEDGSFWSATMNSYNHYAYGAVYDWIFGVGAGIVSREDGPGYYAVDITPRTDERMGHLRASIETRHGKLESAWYYKADCICFEFEIPQETTAHITLPDGYTETVGEGRYCYSVKR